VLRDELIAGLLGGVGPDVALDEALRAALGPAGDPSAAYTVDPEACLTAARRLGCLLAIRPGTNPGGTAVAALWPPAGDAGHGPVIMMGPDPARAACAALAEAT